MMCEVVIERDVGNRCRAFHASLYTFEAGQCVDRFIERDAGRARRGNGANRVLEVMSAAKLPEALGSRAGVRNR